MRDFHSPYVGLGSSSTHAVEATRPCLSASPRKRPSQIRCDPPLRAMSRHMQCSKLRSIRSPRQPIVRRSKRATLLGHCESSPAIDFAHQGVDQLRTVDSRKIVRHWISNGCKTVGQKAIARTKVF